jgi:predicted nucleotidyltransferase
MNIEIPREKIEAFCRKWKIREFALFGSVLRDDFRPDSDVDVLVEFTEDADPTYRQWLAMEDELRAMVSGRAVDLVEKAMVVNPFRRRHILHGSTVVYRAA